MDPRIQFSILGEIDNEYIVFHHDTGNFGSIMIREVHILDTSTDYNFEKGFCINKKNIYYHVSGFKQEIQTVVSKINDHDCCITVH